MKPGDIVKLISGGPEMTVVRIESGFVSCYFWNDEKSEFSGLNNVHMNSVRVVKEMEAEEGERLVVMGGPHNGTTLTFVNDVAEVAGARRGRAIVDRYKVTEVGDRRLGLFDNTYIRVDGRATDELFDAN